MRDGLKIRIPGKIIHGLLAAVIGLAAGWPFAHADDRPAGGTEYVVLTDLVEGDAYFAAAQRLREYRSARMIRFPSGELAAARAPLRQAQPLFVAVVVRPETLDVNFAYDVLELAITVDDDPFTDFAYGFITGATAADALGLVERTIRAEGGAPPTNGLLVAFGPTSTPQADAGNAFEWLPDWSRKRLEHEPKGFPRANLTDLARADVIRFWGHGAPDGVDGSLTRSDLDGLDLRARVVFAGPCFSAVTRRYYESPACSSKLEARNVAPGRSLALAFLARGAVAYFGALQEDRCISAAQEMEHALTSGLPVGMTLKHTHDRITMSQTNGALRLARFREGVCQTGEGVQAQIQWAAARILLGDPAFRPFAGAAATAVEASARVTPSSLEVEAFITDPRIRTLFVNPFRDDLCTCDTDNDTVYARVRLPDGMESIRGPARVDLPPSLGRVGHGPVIWKEEIWDGHRLLHVQLDFKHGGMLDGATNATVRFAMDVAENSLLTE